MNTTGFGFGNARSFGMGGNGDIESQASADAAAASPGGIAAFDAAAPGSEPTLGAPVDDAVLRARAEAVLNSLDAVQDRSARTVQPSSLPGAPPVSEYDPNRAPVVIDPEAAIQAPMPSQRGDYLSQQQQVQGGTGWSGLFDYGERGFLGYLGEGGLMAEGAYDIGREVVRFFTNTIPASSLEIQSTLDSMLGDPLAKLTFGSEYGSNPLYTSVVNSVAAGTTDPNASALSGVASQVASGAFGFGDQGFGLITAEDLDQIFYNPESESRALGQQFGQGALLMAGVMAGGPVGLAATSAMITTAAGQASIDYRDYCRKNNIEASDATALGLMVLNGGAEFVFNKIRIKIPGTKFAISTGQRGVENQIRGHVREALLRGLAANDPQVAKDYIKTYIRGTLSEAAEEAITGAFQQATQGIYRGFGGKDGVSWSEILESGINEGVFGGLMGGGVTAIGTGFASNSAYNSGMRYGASFRVGDRSQAESRIRNFMTDLQVPLEEQTRILQGMRTDPIRDSGAAISSAAATQSPEPGKGKADSGAERTGEPNVTAGGDPKNSGVDDSDLIRIVVQGGESGELSQGDALAEAAARGIVPTDDQKNEIFGGQMKSEGGPSGKQSPALFDRATLHAIATRLMKVAPELARRLRDKGSITAQDLKLFLPGDDAFINQFVRKKLHDRIIAVVKESARASSASADASNKADTLQQILNAGVVDGKPLTEAQKAQIEADIAVLKSESESQPSSTVAATDPAAAQVDGAESQSTIKHGEMDFDLDSMDTMTVLRLGMTLGMDISSFVGKPDAEVRAAVRNFISKRTGDGELGFMSRDDAESAARAEIEWIEAQMELVHYELASTEDQDLAQQLQDQLDDLDGRRSDLQAMLESQGESRAVEDFSGEDYLSEDLLDDDSSGVLGDDATAEEAVAVASEEIFNDPKTEAEANESVAVDALADSPKPEADGVVEFTVEDSRTENEKEIDKVLAKASRHRSRASGKRVVIRRAKQAEIGKVAQAVLRATRRLVSGRGRQVIAVVSDERTGGYGFVSANDPNRIYINVTLGEQEKIERVVNDRKRSGRTKNLFRSALENALYDSYLQTVLHENIHAEDTASASGSSRRLRSLVYVDALIKMLGKDKVREYVSARQGRNTVEGMSDKTLYREFRAEFLSDPDLVRSLGVRAILDQNPGIASEVMSRLRYITANLTGGSKFRQALMRDMADMLNSVTISQSWYGLQRAGLDANISTPIDFQSREPNDFVRGLASAYCASRRIPYNEASTREGVVDIDVRRAMAIADTFESLPDLTYAEGEQHQEIMDAYQAFSEEVIAQYEFLKTSGFTMIPWGSNGQPYANSAEMMRDVRENKRIYYYKTLNENEVSFGSDPEQMAELIRRNPLIRTAGGTVPDSEGVPYEQTVNDLFRAVHDIFGHAKEGQQFGARGEENAWRQHVRMFSPKARIAMTNETRAQNSWVNFGQHLRRADGTVPEAGEEGYVHPTDRPYASQKIVRLPSWVTAENGLDVEAWPGADTSSEILFESRHIADRTSVNTIVTSDIRNSIPDNILLGGQELPYVPGQRPTLYGGHPSNDLNLRNTRVPYPVGQFTDDDMSALADAAAREMNKIHPEAVGYAKANFERHNDAQVIPGNVERGLPAIPAELVNQVFSSTALREDKRFWYEVSGLGFADRFILPDGFSVGKISDYFSATSPLTNVEQNAQRGTAVLADAIHRGMSVVAVTTPSLTRDAAAGRYESDKSLAHKASSFGDTMAMLSGGATSTYTSIPMSTNDIWVAYTFGLRTYNSANKSYGGDNAAFADPYSYMYISIYHGLMAEEINKRVMASPEYAAAKQRAADGTATLEDRALLTPWTPWQVQAYLWSHLSSSGTFDEAIDTMWDMLKKADHPAAKNVGGKKVIDMNLADQNFVEIITPSTAPRQSGFASFEFGGGSMAKGSERSARAAIDGVLSDPVKASAMSAASLQRLRTARMKIYRVLNTMLRFLGGGNATANHPGYPSAAGTSLYICRAADSITNNKTNAIIDNLAASLMSLPDNADAIKKIFNERQAYLKDCRDANTTPDPTVLAGFEASRLQALEASSSLPDAGWYTNSTSGAETMQDWPGLGGRMFNLGITGLSSSGTGFGGYYAGVFSPNVPLCMFGLDSKASGELVRIIGAATGEEGVAITSFYQGKPRSSDDKLCIVFHAAGVELSHDKLQRLKTRVDSTPDMWMSMQLNTIGTDVYVGGVQSLTQEDIDAIAQENGFTSYHIGHTQGQYFERGENNYGIDELLKGYIDADLAKGSSWRSRLSPSQRAAVEKLEGQNGGRNVLRRILSNVRPTERTMGSLSAGERRALADAVRNARSFRVHFSLRNISSESQRANKELNDVVAPGSEVRRILDQESIQFQVRFGNPDSETHREFFRDSKAKNEDGLIPVYHGTVWPDRNTLETTGEVTPFRQFDTSTRGLFGRGTYFTTSSDTANTYARSRDWPVLVAKKQAIPRVYPCYLNIKNPAVMTNTEVGMPQTAVLFDAFFKENHPDRFDEYRQRYEEAFDSAPPLEGFRERRGSSAVTDMLIEMGYDSIHIRGADMNVRGESSEDYYIIFDPSQAKSVWNDNPTGSPMIDMQTREFRDWLGTSEVVNPDGTPTEVYHGTFATVDFNEFRAGKNPGRLGYGIYFSDNPEVAFEFAAPKFLRDAEDDEAARTLAGDGSGVGARIIPSYLRIENPIRLRVDQDTSGKSYVSAFNAALAKATGQSKLDVMADFADFLDDAKTGRMMSGSEYDRRSAEWITHAAKSAGFDGIIAETVDLPNGKTEKTYVVFKPNQVKSKYNQRPTESDRIDMQGRDDSLAMAYIDAGRDIAMDNTPESKARRFVSMLQQDGIPQSSVRVDYKDGRPSKVLVHDSELDGSSPILFMEFDIESGDPTQWYAELLSESIRRSEESTGWVGSGLISEEMADVFTDSEAEVAIEMMARPQFDVLSPMASYQEIEESFRMSGVRLGVKPRALTKWVTSRLNQAFGNEFQVLDALVDHIQNELGHSIPNKYNPVHGLRLRPGVETERIITFSNKTARRIQYMMEDNDVTSEQIGRFMVAMHAPERNERIRQINSGRSDVKQEDLEKLNCGVSDATAQRLLDEHNADPKAAVIETIAESVREIAYDTAQAAKFSGLISDEDFDRITTRYNWYVPMNVTGSVDGEFVTDRVDDALARIRAGRGRSYFASSIDVATGNRQKLKYTLGRKESEETVAAIVRGALGSLFVDRMATEREAITNRVANRLLRLAERYTNNIIRVANDNDFTERRVDPSTDQVVVVKVDPEADTSGQFIPVRLEESRVVNGVEMERGSVVYLVVNDEVLANVLQGDKQKGDPNLGARIGMTVLKLFSTYSSIIRFTATQFLCPDFTFTQPILDGQTSIIESMQDKRVTARGVSKRLLKSMMTIARTEARRTLAPRAETEADESAVGPYSDYYAEYRAVGAKQAWFRIPDVESLVRVLERIGTRDAKSITKETLAQAKRYTVDAYSVLNDIGDNMWRFAYYVDLRENGIDAEAAAVAARNLTVDFSRKGEASSFASSMYAFFNAAVQGNIRTKKQLFTGKTGLYTMSGLTMLGFVNGLLTMLLGGGDEDDDGIPDYIEQIPEYKRRRSINIIGGYNEDGTLKVFTIPLQYGLEIPYLLGMGLVEVGFGQKTVGDLAFELGTNVVTAFNPVGGTPVDTMHGALRAVAPDLGDLALDLGMNRNWSGREIYYGDSPFEDGGSVRSGVGSAREQFGIDWNRTAVAVNNLTGGDEATRGYVDLQPEVWQFLANTFGGSSLRNVERLGGLAYSLYNAAEYGDPLPSPNEVPVVRKWIYEPNQNFYRTNYYEIRDRVKGTQWRIDNYKEDRSKAIALSKTLDGNKRMGEMVKRAESNIRKLRRRGRDLDDAIRNMDRGKERDRLMAERSKVFAKEADIMRQIVTIYTQSGGRL